MQKISTNKSIMCYVKTNEVTEPQIKFHEGSIKWMYDGYQWSFYIYYWLLSHRKFINPNITKHNYQYITTHQKHNTQWSHGRRVYLWGEKH